MGSLNQVNLIGTLGKEPEVKTFQDGSKVVNFTMATNEPARTLKNGTQVPEQTEWHNIVCFGGAATLASSYLHKGQQVHVCGKLRTRSYEDKKLIGVKHYVTEIIVNTITLLGSRQQLQQTPQQPQDQQSQNQFAYRDQQTAAQQIMNNPAVMKMQEMGLISSEQSLPF